VELLDPYQIWCFVIDPYRQYFMDEIDWMGMAALEYFGDAMNFYCPIHLDNNTLAIMVNRRNIYNEYKKLWHKMVHIN
jgi:hypothetical protein